MTQNLRLDRPLRILKVEHIRQIDDALFEIGSFGEVRIIKQNGKLRFIQKVQSENIVELQPKVAEHRGTPDNQGCTDACADKPVDKRRKLTVERDLCHGLQQGER